MDISRTSSDQELNEICPNGSDNNYYYYNTELREHIFDKVLTPSDVGKLNRLVIPKQHAENYFPLEDNQNGTTLVFQDRNGKMWKFRYSYWNSSQSYVMTKGWNRFVKEKKLYAGDTVSFHRSYIADDNEPEGRRKVMFIDYRHRADINLVHNINQQHSYIFGSPTYPTSSTSYYPVTEYSMPSYRSFPPFYQRELLGFGYGRNFNGLQPLDHYLQWNLGRSEPLVYESFPVFPTTTVASLAVPQPLEGTSTTKKVRLFGVDVEECSNSGETHGEIGASASSSSAMKIRADEEYTRKGKSLEF